MKVVYLPLYRLAVSYLVSCGRRWSMLEHLLLVGISAEKRTALELARLSDMPERLVIEALINLMRAGWIEVRTTDAGVYFDCTRVGHLRAKDQDLPATLFRDVRWVSLCVDRLSGTWMRADDLELVYERDLPEDARIIEPMMHTYDPNDGAIRELFYVNADEALEPSLPQFRTPSKPYARITIASGEVVSGLPPLAPMGIKQSLLRASEVFPDMEDVSQNLASVPMGDVLYDDIAPEDIIVGGAQHLALLLDCLSRAETAVIIHSCFLSPDTVRELLPHFAAAAARNVRVELLWGLYTDPEQSGRRSPISETEKVLNALPPAQRRLVQLSPISSGSHAKIVLFDGPGNEGWTTVIGSCNFLSAEFDWVECSVVLRNQKFASQIMARLIAAQLPAFESWSPVARRLNRVWSELRQKAARAKTVGAHRISLLADEDHYACVTLARDIAKERIVIACDLYGLAAETSVLVPMESAAGAGKSVKLFYSRCSTRLREEGREPEGAEIRSRGVQLAVLPCFHAKVLMWDDAAVAITSFNWMSTVVDGGRSRGAEIGVLLEGSGVTEIVGRKLKEVTSGGLCVDV